MNDNGASPQSAADIAREAQATARAHAFFRQWWFSLLVMALISVTNLLPQSLIEILAFQADSIRGGQVWRLLSCHFVHLGTNHYLLNIVGFLILSVAFREDITPREEIISLLLSCLSVSAGLYCFNPEMAWYVGLSGALYGIMAHYLIVGWSRTPFLSAIFILFLASKLLYQQFFPDSASTTGQLTGTAAFIGGPIAEDSHLYGAITGFVTGFISLLLFHRHHVTRAEPDHAD